MSDYPSLEGGPTLLIISCNQQDKNIKKVKKTSEKQKKILVDLILRAVTVKTKSNIVRDYLRLEGGPTLSNVPLWCAFLQVR